MALLPIVLAKIVLLSIMNFLSTNLNLLVSTLFGLRNFLGKHGLWAQDDTKKYPDFENFPEWANQPFIQPASYRYHYVPETGRIETTKAPRFMKIFNGFSQSDSGFYQPTFDKWARTTSGGHQLKESRSVESPGKYKCYWVNDATTDSNTRLAPDLGRETVNLLKYGSFNNFGLRTHKKPLHLYPGKSLKCSLS